MLDARATELEIVQAASSIEMEAKTNIYEAQISELQSIFDTLKSDLKSTTSRWAQQESKLREIEQELDLLQTTSSLEWETKTQIGELQNMLSSIKTNLKATTELSHLQSLEIRRLEIEKKSLRKSMSNAANSFGSHSQKIRHCISSRCYRMFLGKPNGTATESTPKPASVVQHAKVDQLEII